LIGLLLTADDVELHLHLEKEEDVAVVNVSRMETNDREVFRKRLQRQVMRAAGFLFGLEPPPDPYCVTRHYQTLEELDKMGMNFHPPWQARFKAEARERGMEVHEPEIPGLGKIPMPAPPPAPVPPPAP
jgi:hypothetical protein